MRNAPVLKAGIVRGRADAGSAPARTSSSIASPPSMLIRPRKRIWPSLICSARSKICAPGRRAEERQQALDDQHQRDGAEQRGPRTRSTAGYFSRPAAARGAGAAAAHRLEELAARVDDHHVATCCGSSRDRPRGCDRTGRTADRGRTHSAKIADALRVALALDLLRVAVGLGDDHLALAVGVGADLLALGARRSSAAGWRPACARTPSGCRSSR